MGLPDEGDKKVNALPPDDSPDGERGVRQRVEAFIPDLVKKTFAAGLGALLSTEEGIRKLAKDAPKDVAGFLVDTAQSGKDEFLRIVSREVREFLQTVNLSEEIAKLLTTLSFEIKTEIRFIPNDEKVGSLKPDIRARAKLKRSDDKRRRRRHPGGGDATAAEHPGDPDDRDEHDDDPFA